MLDKFQFFEHPRNHTIKDDRDALREVIGRKAERQNPEILHFDFLVED